MARRATSLGPKPSFFFVCCFVCFFGFGFWLFNTNKPCFPPEKGIFCLFSVFLFLSPLAFFDLPLFLFLFPCLSLFFFSFFIPSCLCFLLSFGSLFWSLSLFFFLLWFSFMKGTTSKYSIASFFFISIFSFFSFLPFFVSSSFFFFVFCSTSMFFISKQTTKKKNSFLVKRGVATKRFFFYQPVFWKMSKVIVFLPFFWQFLVDVQKKYYKIGISAHFQKQKSEKIWPFSIVTNWATLIVTNWATFVQLKNGQRGPVSNY